MKVLLIDRYEDSLRKFKNVLQARGYQVYTAWGQGDKGMAPSEFFAGLVMVCHDGQKSQLQIMQEIRGIPEFSLSPILFCGQEQTADHLARLLFDECAPFLPSALAKLDHRALLNSLSGFLLREAA